MTPAQNAAAMHGLAGNRSLPIDDRMQLALQALDWYETDRETQSTRREHLVIYPVFLALDNIRICVECRRCRYSASFAGDIIGRHITWDYFNDELTKHHDNTCEDADAPA